MFAVRKFLLCQIWRLQAYYTSYSWQPMNLQHVKCNTQEIFEMKKKI